MNILITNSTLAIRGGTVLVVRDLVHGLRAAGHRLVVYSPLQQPDIVSDIEACGAAVVSDLASLPEGFVPDLIHGNHHVELVEALLRFPAARGVFVCHHRSDYSAAPPRMDRIHRYVAVDDLCLERLTIEYAIPAAQTRVIYNSVDTDRFLPRATPLPSAPARAAIFSNYAGAGRDTQLEAVRAACQTLNLPLDVIGSGVGNSCAAPEQVLGEYDLVFAKARCAIEAMAVGTAVVLCDAQGLGPMVTSAHVAKLRRWNFGRNVLRGALEPSAIVREAQRYDAADAASVCSYIREHASLTHSTREYLQLYDEVMAEPAVSSARELHQYVHATATRIHELESALAAFRQPYRMEPLSALACAELTMRVLSLPPLFTIERSSVFFVRVEVANASGEKLGSHPPFPVHLSYRWPDVQTESARTQLLPSLPPGEKATYAVRVIAPDAPGRYRLRLTLVQEEIAWLDMIADHVSADALLTVV